MEAHADACVDNYKSMNILCHSLVIEIDFDDKRSVVFTDTQSDEKSAGIFVLPYSY